ncbi:MAG: metal-dependent hydrolase, partial [Balneolaceae bacterium]|nr:metal-dependent hydrolase [Balneolaceae bacterium]
MDTITQFTLGAAVGEAVLGRKAGNKAPLWGSLLGIVPDLDVLANPFLNEVQEIVAHRGISHSLLFCFAASPLIGWMLSRIKWNREYGWGAWGWLVFWVILTHIFVDACTGYGTQVFQPFSNYPVSFNSIFIIDPFYTLPLMAGIVTALFFRRNSDRRKWANGLGLGISTFYLLLGFGIKGHVNLVFEQNFRDSGIEVERYMTTPAPLSEFLWTGYAESRDTVYAGLYSIFDDDGQIELVAVPQRTGLIDPYLDDLPVRRLLWFSNGYYTV